MTVVDTLTPAPTVRLVPDYPTTIEVDVAFCLHCGSDLDLERVRYGLYAYVCPNCGDEHERGYRKAAA